MSSSVSTGLDVTVTSDIVEKQEVLTEKRDKSEILKSAKYVIIVPGYGMALAQAQHLVKELADKFEANGAEVKFAIHPVAGRMPGHMNVLLAEADVPYEQLFEMDDVGNSYDEELLLPAFFFEVQDSEDIVWNQANWGHVRFPEAKVQRLNQEG